MSEELRPGRYRHFKGNEYEVIGVARDSETEQEVVVYRALHGERGLWVRSLAMFTEIVERDARRVQRFEYIPDPTLET
jgi:cyclomaltodextrinase / maltogenic alpha-amylase / neopullulanase